MTDFTDELTAAQAAVDTLTVDFGDAIANGRPSKTIRQKLKEAKQTLEDLEAAQQAIARAHQRVAERQAEADMQAAMAERDRLWKAAETDLNDLRATVAAKDRLLEKLKELNWREESQARAYVDTYGALGMSAQVRDEILFRGWNSQLVQRLKTDCGLHSFLPKLLTYGVAGKAVAACVPTFERLFPKRPKPAEEKEVA